MKFLRTTGIACFAVALTSSLASADVKVTLQNGRVSIVAKDATVRQILTEWARVGQTKVVNVERIPGGPQTIELTNVPEAEALDVLLRAISGFIAAPRTTPAAAGASQFDSIVVMPTAAAPRPPATASPTPATPTMMPQQMPANTDDDTDDERPQAPVAMPPGMQPPGVPPRGPIFNQFPQPQVVNPQGVAMPQPFNQVQPQVVQPPPQTQQPPAQQPSTQPTAPYGGVAVPGMVAPAPAQTNPNQTEPMRRPRGGDGQGA